MAISYDYSQHDWGAIRPMADGTYGTMNPDKVVIHWGGGGPAAEGHAEEVAFLRSWDHFHYYTKGWDGGLAYNYGVGNTGLVYRLRGMNQSGATSGDFDGDGIPENKEALAFLWIGGLKGKPSEAAYQSMERIIRESGLDNITGHLEHKATACPGPEWMHFIAEESWVEPPWPQPASWALPAWNKALALGSINERTFPTDLMEKQAFFVFLDRLGLLDLLAQ